MLTLDMPTRSLESALGVARQIAILTLESEGYRLRDPSLLVYHPRIEEQPERLIMRITAPVTGCVVGTWKDLRLVFTITELECRIEGGQWPFSQTPSASGSSSATCWSRSLATLLEAASPPFVLSQTRYAGQREARNIDLGP